MDFDIDGIGPRRRATRRASGPSSDRYVQIRKRGRRATGKGPGHAPCLVRAYGVSCRPRMTRRAPVRKRRRMPADKGIAARRQGKSVRRAGSMQKLDIEGALACPLFRRSIVSWMYARRNERCSRRRGNAARREKPTKRMRMTTEFVAPSTAQRVKAESRRGCGVIERQVTRGSSSRRPHNKAPTRCRDELRSHLMQSGQDRGSSASAKGGEAQSARTSAAKSIAGGKGGNGAPALGGDAGANAGAPTGGVAGGPAIMPASPPGASGAGGLPKGPANVSCSNGIPGSNAPAKPGGVGALQPGTLTASGWTRTDGPRARRLPTGGGGWWRRPNATTGGAAACYAAMRGAAASRAQRGLELPLLSYQSRDHDDAASRSAPEAMAAKGRRSGGQRGCFGATGRSRLSCAAGSKAENLVAACVGLATRAIVHGCDANADQRNDDDTATQADHPCPVALAHSSIAGARANR